MKDHPEYVGLYAITEDGKVWSHATQSWRKQQPAGKNGQYRQVRLYVGRTGRNHLVHRLVLETYVGPAPHGQPETRHMNGVPHDNRLENLQWGQGKDNQADKKRHGSFPTHCPSGHEYNEANTYMYGNTRFCRVCDATRHRERRAGIR